MSEQKSLPLTPETLLRLGMAIGGAMRVPELPGDESYFRDHMLALWRTIAAALEDESS